jgi:hypothetical protein
MNGLMSTNPCVVVKRKNMQEVLEYCLDQRMAIRALPRGTGDEWELELFPDNHLQAVALGMFLREHKLELLGFGMPSSAPVQKPKPKRNEKKAEQPVDIQTKSDPIQDASHSISVQEATINSLPAFAATPSESVFQIETTSTLEGKPSGLGLFEGDNEEAPFS